MFLRTQRNLNRTYLLLVESYRVQGRMKQRVLFRLGRLDQLRASGVLDRLLGALGRFSEKYAVLGAHAEGQSVSSRARSIGAALIFERLWQDCSIKAVIEALAEKRRIGFELERAVFLRTMKTALATRPIFHKRDDTIRGHVFCSFLALVLRDELERRLQRRGYKFERADILQDLERLQEIELTVNGKGYRLRTDTGGCVAKVFQACGVALPPELQPL